MSPEPVLPAAQQAEVFGRNNVVVQIEGDGNTVDFGRPHLKLTRYLNRRRGGDGPSGEAAEILSPYALAIPFIGRESVMADLRTWMEKDQPISVRVLTARGGGGKTRLALELCDEATRKGWFAGFVTDRELQRFLAQQNLSTWGWNRPTLVVIDYAASRARLLHDWLVELADNVGDSGHPLRLLLLERHADPSMGWWLEAFGRGGGDALAVRRLLDPVSGPYALPALNASERRSFFAKALELAGSNLRPPETPEFESRLAELSWGSEPLFIMMAGLTAARAGLRYVLALSPIDLVLEVADHELERIREIGESWKVDPKFLTHVAAYVTLCQGLTREKAEEAIEIEKRMLRYESAGDPPVIYEALYNALPEGLGGLGPVLPDLVGEAVVLRGLGAGDSSKAADAVSRAVLSGAQEVLVVVPQIVQDFGTELAASMICLQGLFKAADVDKQLRWRIFRLFSLPVEPKVRRAIAELIEIMLPRLRQAEDRHYLAAALNSLALIFNGLGEPGRALIFSQDSVSLARDLESSDSEQFRSDLAMSLVTNAVILRGLGRGLEALNSIYESVRLNKFSVDAGQHRYQPDLAASLEVLGGQLRELGYKDSALDAYRQAIEIYRELVSRGQGFQLILSRCLYYYSLALKDLGAFGEAFDACQEAVGLLVPIFLGAPSIYNYMLARTVRDYLELAEVVNLEPLYEVVKPLLDCGFLIVDYGSDATGE